MLTRRVLRICDRLGGESSAHFTVVLDDVSASCLAYEDVVDFLIRF